MTQSLLVDAGVEVGLWNVSWTAAVAASDSTAFRWAMWQQARQQKTKQSTEGLIEYSTDLELHSHNIAGLIVDSVKSVRLDAAEAELLFFIPCILLPCQNPFPCQLNRRQINVFYTVNAASSPKQRWGVGYRAPVNSLLCNSTSPDFFHFQFCSLLPSSDITWGNSSDFPQLSLEPQKTSYNFFSHILQSYPKPVNGLWCVKSVFLFQHIVACSDGFELTAWTS